MYELNPFMQLYNAVNPYLHLLLQLFAAAFAFVLTVHVFGILTSSLRDIPGPKSGSLIQGKRPHMVIVMTTRVQFSGHLGEAFGKMSSHGIWPWPRGLAE